MKHPLSELEEQYTCALRDSLARPEEAALKRAYELGRKALDEGLGVLEFVALYHKALFRILAGTATSKENAGIVKMAESFFVESLAPFEMAHRSFREANIALHQLNERLEKEARRIAHALHDEAGQLLACVHIALEDVARELPFPSRKRLQEVRVLLDQIEGQLRRLSHELRPTILDDLGLLPALEFLAEGVSQRASLPITVEGERAGRFPSPIETALYRVVQEALTNVARHAQATHASVQIQREPGSIHCSIRDNGIGFDVPVVMARKGQRGLGLVGIRERIAVLGGTLQIRSESGRGTEMVITVPVET
jgi:signal transduction histidine kinase